jgi:hypothetical protein
MINDDGIGAGIRNKTPNRSGPSRIPADFFTKISRNAVLPLASGAEFDKRRGWEANQTI